MTKKQNQQIIKREIKHRENNLLRNSHIDPNDLPNNDITLGRVCRRSWGGGRIKK